jgi:hypothetical protein
MKRTLALLLTVALLLVTAHRLPAPIHEVPESPTPTPAEQAKPKKTQAKPKSVESEPKAKSASKPSATPAPQSPARFAGTWTGRIKIGNQGDFDVTLVVNSEATSLTQSTNRSPQHVHPTITSGRTLLWRGGNLNNVAWTLTPKPNGQTASATTKTTGIENTAIFRKVSP